MRGTRALVAGLLVAALSGCAVLGPPTDVREYAIRRTPAQPVIDGRIDDAAWSAAPWSDRFVDIEGDARPRPRLGTRVRMLWDDDALYIAAQMAEPDVWARVTEHDAVVFHDNDFELFVDPDGDSRNYVEIEVNALGTVWDLVLPKPYCEDGHPRNDWESGAAIATSVDGTLNDPSDEDRGWTVEMAIPRKAFDGLTSAAMPPRPGDVWSADFSRVEWDTRVEPDAARDRRTVRIDGRPEHNWVWSPPGVVDMHRPWLWGRFRFAR